MARNGLSKYTTRELLYELKTRWLWFYCWSPETIVSDYEAAGIEQPTADECVELCERIENEIDKKFFDMEQALLLQMRSESEE